MRNFLVSLYLTIAMLLGMMRPCCAGIDIPLCCSQQTINTASIQNECCCCSSLPIDQASRSVQLTAPNNIEPQSGSAALLSHGIYFQSINNPAPYAVNNEKYKRLKLYIFYRSLLL